MKKITILLLATTITLTTFGQTQSETIKNAKELIANKKYESAYKVLDTFDPKNNKPDIVLLKEDIVLNYFVSSMMHQMFALKDLQKNEDVMDYRGKEGSYGMVMFQIDSILNTLIKANPTNCNLYKGLGDYYYEVHLKYGGQWLKDDNELFKLIKANNKKAIEGNCADYLTYYVLGYIALSDKKNKEAIPYFLKSIELNKDYASSHYNLAYAYLFTDDKENALKYAMNSFDLYTDQSYKGDAARMIAQIYFELKDDKNTIKYYELANTIDTDNYYNLKPLLNIYVKMGNSKAKATLNSFYNLAPDKPTIYNDLSTIYYDNKKTDELIEFFKSKLTTYTDQKKILGNLNFYLARLYLDSDKKIAKEYFMKARDVFTTIYDKDNKVFQAIDDGLKETE